MHHVVTGSGEQQLLPDTRHFIWLTNATEEVHVGGRLPRAEARARSCAGGATLLTMNTVVGPEFRFEMEWQIFALLMLVTDDVMWTGDDATRAPRAETGVNDFGFEFFPLGGPTAWSGGLLGRAHEYNVGDEGCNGASGTAESLDRGRPLFTGANSHDSLNSGYPYFAVANLVGARSIGDGVDNQVDL